MESHFKDWKTLHHGESFGGYGDFGLKIEVAGTHLPAGLGERTSDFKKHEEIRHAIYDAEKKITFAIRRAAVMEDPEQIRLRKEEREELLALFGSRKIFVEEVPNGYMSTDWYFSTRPWFVVTTDKGRIKLGWRKRVIEIEWSDAPHLGDGADLFSDQNVTVNKDYVHACSLEKAKEYLDILLAER